MKKRIFIIVLAVLFSTMFSVGAHQTGNNKIGSTIENDDRKATFNSAKISETLIELNFTIENTGSSDIKIISFLSFRAENNAGVDLTNDSFSCEGNTIDGTVSPGGTLTGSVCFKVREPSPYKVYYQPGWTASPDDFMWAVLSEPASVIPESVEVPAETITNPVDLPEPGSPGTVSLFVFQNNLINPQNAEGGNQETVVTESPSSGSIFDKFLSSPDTAPIENTAVQSDSDIESTSGIETSNKVSNDENSASQSISIESIDSQITDLGINSEKQLLLNNMQTTFPYVAINKNNWGLYGVQTDLGSGKTFTSWFENGIYHSVLSASALMSEGDSYGFYLGQDLGLFNNFALHANVVLADVRPAGGYGDCYLSYTDKYSVDENQSKWLDVELGYNIDTYDSASDDSKTWYDLSSYGEIGRNYSIDVIRMNGIANIFIDGVYIGEVEDGITENVTMWLGTYLGSDSQYVDCTFDNFEIRTQ